MLPAQLGEIRGLLSLAGWEQLTSRIELVPTDETIFLVEDEQGQFHDYMFGGTMTGEPDVPAEVWLGYPEWQPLSDEELAAYHRDIAELRQAFPDADGHLILWS